MASFRPSELAIAGARAAAEAIRRHGVGGSIGIDLPTVEGKAARQAAADAVDEVLPKPFERTSVNGFGFLQIVRPRTHASLFELAADRASFEARALLRAAGARSRCNSPRSTSGRDCRTQSQAGLVGPALPPHRWPRYLAQRPDARHVRGTCRTRLNPARSAASRHPLNTPPSAAAAARIETCSNGSAKATASLVRQRIRTGWTATRATARDAFARGADRRFMWAQVAQLVEHATENRSVGGSIPPLGTICSRELPSILAN